VTSALVVLEVKGNLSHWFAPDQIQVLKEVWPLKDISTLPEFVKDHITVIPVHATPRKEKKKTRFLLSYPVDTARHD